MSVYSRIEDINAAGTLVAVNISMIGTSIRVSEDALTEEARAAGVKANKDIIAARYVEPIRKAGEGLRKAIKVKCIPRSTVGAGIYWTSNDMIPDIEDIWTREHPKFVSAVTTFIRKWPEIVDDARRRLGEWFSERDYPSEGTLRRHFDARLRRFNIVGSSAHGSSQDVREMVEEFQRDVTAYMRETFGEFVNWLTRILTPTADESGQMKRPQFKASKLENFHEFLNTFQRLNVANDDQLAAQVARVRGLLDANNIDRNYGAERLRSNDALAHQLRQQMEVVKATVNDMIENTPGRRVRLED